MTATHARKETRLVARASSEIQDMIQRAADYSGATISQFLIDASIEKARAVIAQTETLALSTESADALMAVLDNPPNANAKLLQAGKHYRDSVHDRPR
jgi:uncharacterized protein (DUF1778 family)